MKHVHNGRTLVATDADLFMRVRPSLNEPTLTAL